MQSPLKKDEKLEDDAQLEKSISCDSSFIKKKKKVIMLTLLLERERKKCLERIQHKEQKTTHGGKPERDKQHKLREENSLWVLKPK